MSKCEKVFGIYIDEKLSFKKYVYKCVNEASRMCASVLNNIKNVDNSVLIKLFNCFIRPLLEFSSVVNSLHHIGLKDFIDNVQRRFTKRLFGMNDISYSHRLKLCNLEVSELCRLHADLIMMYKILNGVLCVYLENCIPCLQCILPEEILLNCINIV